MGWLWQRRHAIPDDSEANGGSTFLTARDLPRAHALQTRPVVNLQTSRAVKRSIAFTKYLLTYNSSWTHVCLGS